MSLVKIANKLPKLNGMFFGVYVMPPIPTYKITLFPSPNGSISADTLEGIEGTLVTLSNTPDTHYSFGGYGITGATLTGNQFLIGQDNISVQGSFIEDAKYSLSLTQTTGGRINANKNTGYAGDIITLSNTPSSHYSFNGYGITGATLTGNQFAFGSQNVTAKGTFVADPIRTVTLTQVAGGNITANPTTGYDGTTVTLSNTANAGYTFNNYTLTGGTLTGNKFVLNGGNATASLNLTHNVYNLTLQTDGHGKLVAGKTTGYYNDTTTLSTTASAGYNFKNYSVTGGTITNNTFKWGTSNATVKANFSAKPIRSVTLSQQTGGTITANPMTGYDGTVVTLSNTANSGYIFSSYSITGSTLTGNKFKFGTQNVTAKGTFKQDPNPLNLNPYTIRLKFKNGITLTSDKGTLRQVSQNPNIWDYTYNNNNWLSLVEYLDYNNSPLNTRTLIEVLGANTSGVQNMDQLFFGCSALSSVAYFDTSHVKNTQYMFGECYSLSSVPLYNTTNVNDCDYMFIRDYSLTTVPSFNLTNASSTMGMFEYCTKLRSTPAFTTTKVLSSTYMYLGCSSLSSVGLFNTSSLKDSKLMFGQCSKLNSSPVFDTRNVLNMDGMFSGCRSIKTIPQFNTNKVRNMDNMFSGCKSLTSVPLLNTQNVSSMWGTFSECTALKGIPLFNTSKTTNTNKMFYNCKNVSSGISALYNQLSTQSNPPVIYYATFSGCGTNTVQGRAELALVPELWGGTKTN